MTVPWEAMDSDHPDHDAWVAVAGRCFAAHRHQADFLVFRHHPDVPREQWCEPFEGRWQEPPDPLRICIPRPGDRDGVTVLAEATPTNRFETRDDGALARVWEIRLVSD